MQAATLVMDQPELPSSASAHTPGEDPAPVDPVSPVLLRRRMLQQRELLKQHAAQLTEEYKSRESEVSADVEGLQKSRAAATDPLPLSPVDGRLQVDAVVTRIPRAAVNLSSGPIQPQAQDLQVQQQVQQEAADTAIVIRAPEAVQHWTCLRLGLTRWLLRPERRTAKHSRRVQSLLKAGLPVQMSHDDPGSIAIAENATVTAKSQTFLARVAAVDAAEALVEYTNLPVDELAAALPADISSDGNDPRAVVLRQVSLVAYIDFTLPSHSTISFP